MKFDIVIGNPPYGFRTEYTHLKIMKTVLPLCKDKLTFIMPSKPIIQQLDNDNIWMRMFKEAVCTDIQTVKKGTFENTNMDATAIYYCDRKINDTEKYCKKLDVEDVLYSSISDEGRLFMDKFQEFYNKGNKSIKPFIGWDRRNKEKYTKRIKPGHYYLSVNRAGTKPGMGIPIWISGELEKLGILDSYNEISDLENRTKQINILDCPNEQYGKNLKTLMTDCFVLRYGLWLQQVNQEMKKRVFKYVPAIDYTEIDTDEKLLSVCGFSDTEIKKILYYLKNFDFKTSRNDTIRDYTDEVIKSPVEQKEVESTIYFSATYKENSEVEDTDDKVDSEDSPLDQSTSTSTSDSLPKSFYNLDRERLDPSFDIPEDEKYDEEGGLWKFKKNQ